MVSLEIQKFQIDPEEIFRDPLSKELLETLCAFSDTVTRLGYNVSLCTRDSLQRLPLLPPEKKRQIISTYQTWHQWIRPLLNAQPALPNEKGYDPDSLKRVLDYYGYVASDEFWKTLEKDQLIEIYGRDMIQCYRSLSFFHFCGYSLLDLSVNEWYVLWERPRRINQEMEKFANTMLSNYSPLEDFRIPKHVLRETYRTGLTERFQPRAILIEFLKIASLRRASRPEELAGFICTSRASIIAEGEEALNIQFI